MSHRLIQLSEGQPAELELSPEELADLQRANAGLAVSPHSAGRYVVQPGSVVGSFTTARLHVVIRPKFEIERLFHLLSTARRVAFLPSETSLQAYREITD